MGQIDSYTNQPPNPPFVPYYPDEGSGYATQPNPVTINYQWEPPVCSCDYSGRHSWFTHWFRVRYMKRAW